MAAIFQMPTITEQIIGAIVHLWKPTPSLSHVLLGNCIFYKTCQPQNSRWRPYSKMPTIYHKEIIAFRNKIAENCIFEWSRCPYIEGVLPKGSYLPCVSMAGRTLLAGHHRHACIPTVTLANVAFQLAANVAFQLAVVFWILAGCLACPFWRIPWSVTSMGPSISVLSSVRFSVRG